jgi:hypothetical protein
MGTVYFLAGVASTIIGMLVLANKGEKVVKAKQWKRLKTLTWEMNLGGVHFLQPADLNDVAHETLRLMHDEIHKRPFNPAPAVDTDVYNVRVTATLHFFEPPKE